MQEGGNQKPADYSHISDEEVKGDIWDQFDELVKKAEQEAETEGFYIGENAPIQWLREGEPIDITYEEEYDTAIYTADDRGSIKPKAIRDCQPFRYTIYSPGGIPSNAYWALQYIFSDADMAQIRNGVYCGFCWERQRDGARLIDKCLKRKETHGVPNSCGVKLSEWM